MDPKPAENREETRKYIATTRKKIQQGKELVMAILIKDIREFLGHCGIHETDTPTPELGIWIKKNAHGQKYGREAVEALKKWADNHLKYEYIRYPVDRNNIASRKIAEYLGGVAKKKYIKINMSKRKLDIVEYWIYPKNNS